MSTDFSISHNNFTLFKASLDGVCTCQTIVASSDVKVQNSTGLVSLGAKMQELEDLLAAQLSRIDELEEQISALLANHSAAACRQVGCPTTVAAPTTAQLAAVTTGQAVGTSQIAGTTERTEIASTTHIAATTQVASTAPAISQTTTNHVASTDVATSSSVAGTTGERPSSAVLLANQTSGFSLEQNRSGWSYLYSTSAGGTRQLMTKKAMDCVGGNWCTEWDSFAVIWSEFGQPNYHENCNTAGYGYRAVHRRWTSNVTGTLHVELTWRTNLCPPTTELVSVDINEQLLWNRTLVGNDSGNRTFESGVTAGDGITLTVAPVTGCQCGLVYTTFDIYLLA